MALPEPVLFRGNAIYGFAPPNNALSVDFFQRSISPRLIEDETSNDSDIMNNLIDYEEGQEPDSLRVDKNMQGSSFPTNCPVISLLRRCGQRIIRMRECRSVVMKTYPGGYPQCVKVVDCGSQMIKESDRG
ncbi:hypothetical protein TNCV_772851 [Trichonephila clavipes]|nr:hypothetical protein TNCV_772851 [Trichonephila clavipes]